MSQIYRAFFGFTREPFCPELKVEDILKTDAVLSVIDRVDYAIRLGAMAMITGEVGSGKSTALRFAMSRFHPSEYRLLWVTAGGGSILELYRQIAWELEVETSSYSRAALTRIIRKGILDLVLGKKQKAVLVVDEASLLRLEVFAEIHTLTQFDGDSKPILPMILAGQNNLLDKLYWKTSLPCLPGSWPEVISKGSIAREWSSISLTTSKSLDSIIRSSANRLLPRFIRAQEDSSEGPIIWQEEL